MERLIDTIKRYAQKDTSSLAFWWLPLYEGSGNYNLSKNQLCDYYLDFSSKAEYDYLFDENGVLLLDYKGRMGIQYNPCAVAQYGLGLCSKYIKTLDKLYLKKMETQANWLYDIMKIDGKGIGRLEYTFSADDYNQISNHNYISAIAQGQAVSFLIRCSIILGDKKYANAANALYQCFRYSALEGGVVNYDEQGRMYLEEAVTERISCILDGFIYAMFGVYDYYLFTGERESREIFYKCCETVEERLPDFDLGFWSRADCYMEKPKMPASKFYHNVHIQQLKALYVITGNEIYRDYADKWEGYQKNFLFQKLAFLYKCWFKIFYY
ncbi:D-glucuronyl C5-epimerase family protein [Anaerostipes caccae]|uniref:D-glucuronyl C5-epimerase family protein n=1 Tax=Anaerostipes caccae TaxID=105841 RepID=UPI0038D3CEBB